MYFHSVKLKNYKSIGDYDLSEIIIEPEITALVGKNESGKSNVLEALSQIRFSESMSAAFNDEFVNRSNGTPVEFEIVLKSYPAEMEMGIVEDTTIIIKKDTQLFSGGAIQYFYEKIHGSIIQFVDLLDTNDIHFSGSEQSTYLSCKAILNNTEKFNILKIEEAFGFIRARLGQFSVSQRENTTAGLNRTYKVWRDFLQFFPKVFFHRTDKILKTRYGYDDAKRILSNPLSYPDDLLPDFVRLIGMSNDDVLSAISSGTSGKKTSLRNKIRRKIRTEINEPFRSFYETEEIELDVDFDASVLSFNVQSSDGETLLLSERSNGLRWYLFTFIDARANDISGNNTLFLLDEPGISLHVNAQRELLTLFHDLVGKGNQLLYTTHSPYMLDIENEGIHRIRAITKDNEGYTKIFKNAYDARIAPDSQHDTLAPIISALGMSLQSTFGPAIGKVNVITEGMSDYIFLCGMAKHLKLDTNKFAIIPSVGATNAVNLCSILQGWGCDFIALFDYDNEGVKKGGEYLKKNFNFQCGTQYCYTKDVQQGDIDNQTYKTETYMIEDVVTDEELMRFCSETNTSRTLSKSLIAKIYSDSINSGSFSCGSDCEANFKALFKRLRCCE